VREAALPAEIKRHRFTSEEYRRMGEVGLLGEDDRVELIGGEILEMAPIGDDHVEAVLRLTGSLHRSTFSAPPNSALGAASVSVQNPISLDEGGEPQPDLVLLGDREGRRGVPAAGDALLIIEVSDTTLSYDKNIKLPLYATSGIREVWIVDLNGRKVEVHSEPGAGGYRHIRIFGPGESVASATVEGLSVPADEILG
jgi:Uma2 family endonuclease